MKATIINAPNDLSAKLTAQFLNFHHVSDPSDPSIFGKVADNPEQTKINAANKTFLDAISPKDEDGDSVFMIPGQGKQFRDTVVSALSAYVKTTNSTFSYGIGSEFSTIAHKTLGEPEFTDKAMKEFDSTENRVELIENEIDKISDALEMYPGGSEAIEALSIMALGLVDHMSELEAQNAMALTLIAFLTLQHKETQEELRTVHQEVHEMLARNEELQGELETTQEEIESAHLRIADLENLSDEIDGRYERRSSIGSDSTVSSVSLPMSPLRNLDRERLGSPFRKGSDRELETPPQRPSGIVPPLTFQRRRP